MNEALRYFFEQNIFTYLLKQIRNEIKLKNETFVIIRRVKIWQLI
jgi:hypothetical protein